MASEKSASYVEYHDQSEMQPRAYSQSSINAPPNFEPHQQQPAYISQYPVPRSMPQGKLPFARPPKQEGLGKSYVVVGSFQIFMGLLIFVLALIGLSVSRNGSAYSAGFVGGIAFMITGTFGCIAGTYDGDCYPMTYFVCNMLSVPASLLCIGLSGWEISGMGIATVLRSSEGYLTVKCVLVILGCVSVLIVSSFQAYKLRHVECCECTSGKRRPKMPQGNPYAVPADYGLPVSNQTTNSSWHWNLQHNVNQQQPEDYPRQPQHLHKQYLEQLEEQNDPFPQEQYSRQEKDEMSSIDRGSYDQGRGGDVHRPSYI